MDINAVSRALHALNMIYFKSATWNGVGIGVLIVGNKHWEENGFSYCRKSLKYKAIALVEHDRVINSQRSWFEK